MDGGPATTVLGRRRRTGALWAGLGGVATFAVVAALPATEVVAAVLYTGLAGGGVALVVLAATRVTSPAPWVLLGTGAAVLVLCQLSLLWSGGGYDPGTAATRMLDAVRGHPVLAAAGLVAYPLLYAGQMVLLRQRVRRLLPSAWLDGVLVAALLGAATTAFVVPPVAAHLGLGVTGTAALVVRPVLDLLMAAFALANWSLSGWTVDRRLPLLFGSFAALTLADTVGLLQLVGLLGHEGPAAEAADTGRLLALLALSGAATAPVRAPRRALATESWSHLVAPAIALVGALTLLRLDRDRPLGAVAGDLLLVCLALVGLKFVLVLREVLRLADSRRLALTDDLTGLANRRGLRHRMDEHLATGAPAALLLLDLDGFKHVNDRFGHGAGDELLRRTADRLRDRLPVTAALARLGGDEFAVLLPGASADEGTALATALVGAMDEPVPVGHRLLRSPTSIGVSTTPDTRDSRPPADELLRRADTAMYRAKRRRDGTAHGGWDVHDDRLDALERDREQLLEDLRSVLGGRADEPRRAGAGGLVAHYQPQLDLRTGTVVGAEALVRWHHPTRGVLTPDVFLDLVEDHGLMASLTTGVLRQAAVDAGTWRQHGHHLRVSVNLSTSCLVNPALLELVDDVLATTGLPAGDLVLEITETTLMHDPPAAVRTAYAVTRRGVGLSIDDYGTGYASMSYLHDLPATELKLDRSFTVRLGRDERTTAVVASTVDLAHRLGMRLVAEGVEDVATLDALRSLGCDDTQGYLHARPLPPADFLAWLARHRPSPGVDAAAVRPAVPQQQSGGRPVRRP